MNRLPRPVRALARPLSRDPIRALARLSAATLVLAALTACGGGDGAPVAPPPVVPPPPVTPPTPVAASVSVLAGSGQTVPASGATPIAPSVVVRDAQGQPFAGATVQFAVVAGGGTLEGATQTSNADGIASVTRWTVGATGTQRLSATVGSLAPATIDATIDPVTEVFEQAVPPTGGTIGISTPGHPYQGLTLTIPGNTVPAAANWTLQLHTGAAPPALPAGYRLAGPLLDITTDAPRGAALMTLDVPVHPLPGEAVVLVFYDPARRVLEVLPTVARTDSTIRVVTTHLRADLLRGSRPSGIAASRAAQTLGASLGSLMPVLVALPQAPVPPVLSAGQTWPVLDNGSAEVPNGFGPTIPVMTVMATQSGLSADVVKGLSTPGTYADGGILGAMEAAANTPGINGAELRNFFAQFGNMPKSQRDELTSQVMTAELALTLKPGLAALFKSNQGPTDDETWFTNTVAAGNNTLTTKEPTKPGTGLLSKMAGGFDGLTVQSTNDGPTTSADGALPMSSFVFDFQKTDPYFDLIKQYDNLTPQERITLNEQLITLLKTKTDLEMEVLPGGGFYKDPDKTVPVRNDELTIRVAGGRVKFSLHDVFGPEVDRSNGPGLDLATHVGPTNGQKKSLILSTFEQIGTNIRQMLPQGIEVARARFSASPDTARVGTDTATVTFQADVPLPPPGGFRVRWDWGDGTSTNNLSLTSGTHFYGVSGNYTVTATLLSADGSRVLSVDTVYVKQDVSPHWRLTSLTNLDGLDTDELGPLGVILQRALASPASAMIAIDPGSGVLAALRLRVLANGSWSAANCCAVSGAPEPGESSQRLGVSPSFSYPVGPWFAGYGENRFSVSTSDLGSGTMSSQYVLGTFTYFVRDAGFQLGPTATLRLEGTRSGTSLTGTITVVLWEVGNSTPPQVTPAELYFLSFTAVRMK